MVLDIVLLLPALLLGWCAARAVGGWLVQCADRGEPVRFGVPELALTAREASAHALFLVMQPFVGRGAALPPATPSTDARRLPLVLLAEDRTGRAGLVFLRTFLRHRGWSYVWPLHLDHGDASLAEQAEALARRIEDVLRATGSEKVDLVAHGSAGVVAAWYAQHLEGAPKLGRLVTMSTPWQGTRTAVFRRGRLPLELHHRAPLLEGLAPPAAPTVAIWSPDDPQVVPATSSLPTGAHAIRIDKAGSFEMLLSARAYRAVQEALLEPLPQGAP